MNYKKKFSDTIALYIQIADDLRMKILSKEWKPGDKIPAELDLCELYHVSRITIRKSIDELVKEHLVYRERAKGTFVREWEENDEKQFTYIRSFTNEMKELGKDAITIKSHIEVIKADKKLSHYLNINVNDPVMMLKRTRGTEGEGKAFAYFINYFTYGPNYPTNDEAYYGSLYALLREHKVVINQEKEYIEAIAPTKEIQQALEIQKNTPVLKRIRMTKQVESNFHEYSECFYIGTQYRYYIDFYNR